MRRTSIITTALAVGALALSGCGSDDDGGGGGSSATGTGSGSSSATDSPAGSDSPAATGDAVLATADTDLGTVVVDGQGMTVYVFDSDVPGSGTSNCSGQCLEAWPPVVAESDSPQVDGVTGEVGTITRDDGTRQVTLEGWPLYLWQGDTAPGDTTGQAVQGVWWVIGPDGTKVTGTTAPAAVPAY
jgi:predicted lipoprotein with Yx(FWY)xxD motif